MKLNCTYLFHFSSLPLSHYFFSSNLNLKVHVVVKETIHQTNIRIVCRVEFSWPQECSLQQRRANYLSIHLSVSQSRGAYCIGDRQMRSGAGFQNVCQSTFKKILVHEIWNPQKSSRTVLHDTVQVSSDGKKPESRVPWFKSQQGHQLYDHFGQDHPYVLSQSLVTQSTQTQHAHKLFTFGFYCLLHVSAVHIGHYQVQKNRGTEGYVL